MSGVNPEEFRALGERVTRNTVKVEDHDRRIDEAREEHRDLQKQVADMDPRLQTIDQKVSSLVNREKAPEWITPANVKWLAILAAAVAAALTAVGQGGDPAEVATAVVQAMREAEVTVP